MTPPIYTLFNELQDLAIKIRNKTGDPCKVCVSFWAFKTNEVICYELYQDKFRSPREYSTVKELKTAMNEILNPSKDTGVSIKEAA